MQELETKETKADFDPHTSVYLRLQTHKALRGPWGGDDFTGPVNRSMLARIILVYTVKTLSMLL